MRRLLLAWLERNLHEPNTGSLIANLMNTAQFPELTDVALSLVLNKRATAYVRANVMVSFGRMNLKDVAPRLEPLITDDTQVSQFMNNNVRYFTKLGDVALCMVIHLNGQQPIDYGFEGLRTTPSAIFSYYRLGFTDDAKREAARKQWQEWKAKQK